jgi:hypothetical protein
MARSIKPVVRLASSQGVAADRAACISLKDKLQSPRRRWPEAPVEESSPRVA